MNKAIILGRLTKDPETKNTQNGIALTNFTVAVDRPFKDANGNKQADFINCVAWRNTATFISKYFHKGNKILIEGSIQTRSYEDNNGAKRYAVEVLVDNAEFVESAREANTEPQSAPIAPVVNIPEAEEDETGLPFEV